MFHLGGTTFPTQREQLASSVQEGLRRVMALPAGRSAVTLKGDWPALQGARIDLSGATVDTDNPPPDPRPVGPREPAVTVGQFEVAGQPLLIRGGGAVRLELTGRNASFEYGRDREGRPLLLLRDAQDGHVRLTIERDDLETILLAAATKAAAAQGVTITEATLDLGQVDARTVSVGVRVIAKKSIAKAIVRVEGRLGIDDELVAKLSGLDCHGEGMLGKIASAALKPHLKQIEGRPLPLAALSLGDVRLHDLKISVVGPLDVTAKFGSAG